VALRHEVVVQPALLGQHGVVEMLRVGALRCRLFQDLHDVEQTKEHQNLRLQGADGREPTIAYRIGAIRRQHGGSAAVPGSILEFAQVIRYIGSKRLPGAIRLP
jgi:hypothetical protein